MDAKYCQKTDPHFATKAIHAGQAPENWNSLPMVPPITLSTTFKQITPGKEDGYVYGRSGNPSRDALEQCIAALENGKYGLCYSAGLSALMCITYLADSGDHVICGDDVYGGTNRFFQKVASKLNFEVSFVEAVDPTNIEKAIKPNTKVVWIETPTNPTMKLVDIAAVSEILKRHKNIIHVVDNTFLSPYFQRPLDLGADVVVHSLTKYMNGHTDVIMGAIATNNDELYEKLKFLQNATGIVPSPFDCYLVNRGLKTLHLRMREHMKNGLAVAKFLESHPLVKKVIHPGLPSHPQHKLALKQTSGYSGMLSFYIKGGLEESKIFLSNLKVFTLAESLGGCDSLAELPSIMTHASVPPEQRAHLGVTDSLIRLSVGLESEVDLIEDLDQALKKAAK